jgi:CCR4-NOT transcriptional regulation complex NOT5 subunit
MKLKLHAMILLMLGFVSFIFGARAVFEQYSFAVGAEAVQGTVISVGTSGKTNTTDVAVSYVQDGVVRTDRLHLSLFSNSLEFSEGESLILRVSSDSERDPEAYRGTQDAIMYYVAGIFFMLLGLVFAMFGLLIQRFGKD